jgi:hypothetical protein
MRIFDTVKTEKHARKLLKGDFVKAIKKGACQCECGETEALIAIGKDYLQLGSIGICDCCGDDSRTFGEVFYS